MTADEHPTNERATSARDIEFEVDGAVLRGSLELPSGSAGRAPAVLLLGGTFSDLRDGDPDPRERPGVPVHKMYAHLARSLAARGIASLRFDRRGCGQSTGERGEGRAREIADAAAAWDHLTRRPEVGGRLAMAGESAGAYVLCRLVAGGRTPDAAVLQGALHRSIVGLLRFNIEQAQRYLDRGQAARSWVNRHAPHVGSDIERWHTIEHVLGPDEAYPGDAANDPAIADALAGIAFELHEPPAEQFAVLRCPTLVIHGANDMNVPVADAFATVRSLWDAGNRDVELQILAGADHSLQLVPDDDEERIRERLTLRSFARPYHPRYPGAVVEYLARQLLLEDAGLSRGPCGGG